MTLAELPGDNAAAVAGYATAILDGTKLACKELRQGVQRFERDLASGRWDFDPAEADYVIRKIETQFVHLQGETLTGEPLKGKPLLLEPWQTYIVYNLLGFYEPGTKIRRYKEAFIFIPRKNGKTIFAAALAWALAMLSAKSGAVIYIAAAALRQAMQSYRDLYANLEHMYGSIDEAKDDGWRILDNNNEHIIEHMHLADGSVHIEALAANPDNQDSLNCNVAIADEMHAFRSAKQYNILREAMKAYTNKLMIGITTAGDNMTSFCCRRLRFCQRILETDTHDEYTDTLFIFICKADESEGGSVDYTNPVEHEKANPNYGVSIRPGDMLAQSLEASNDPQQRKDFLAKSLNIYVASMKAYFDITEFQRSDARYNWTLEELAKLPIQWYGGADLSKLHDLTAACLYGTYKDTDIVIPHAWFPVLNAARKADEDNIPLFGWQDDGWLTMTNTPTTNHQDVVSWFVKMRAMGFKIAQVGHDRKFVREYYIGMKKAGFKIVDQPQYYVDKSEGFRHIEAKAKNGLLCYLHSDAYEYCVQNVLAIEKVDDMIQYQKIDEHLRIDIFDASVFACIRMLKAMERKQADERWLYGTNEKA